MSDFIQLKTTDHQIVFINKNNIAGVEPVTSSSRTSEHIRVFAGGYKWLIDESLASFLPKLGIDPKLVEAIKE